MRRFVSPGWKRSSWPARCGSSMHEMEVGPDERRVVVAALPDDHVCRVLGEVEDLRVVDAGEDDVAGGDVRLVLLALLDRAVGGLEILVALEALRDLLREVAVRHRMAKDGDAVPASAEDLRHAAARLALAGAGAHGADGDARLPRRRARSPAARRAGSRPPPRARATRCASRARARRPSTRTRPRSPRARRRSPRARTRAGSGCPPDTGARRARTGTRGRRCSGSGWP